MLNEIHVKVVSIGTDDAATVTAFNTLITTLRALPGARFVDAGGTVIGGVKRTADEADSSKTRKFGDQW